MEKEINLSNMFIATDIHLNNTISDPVKRDLCKVYLKRAEDDVKDFIRLLKEVLNNTKSTAFVLYELDKLAGKKFKEKKEGKDGR